LAPAPLTLVLFGGVELLDEEPVVVVWVWVTPVVVDELATLGTDGTVVVTEVVPGMVEVAVFMLVTLVVT
jgi:hypothetical protein